MDYSLREFHLQAEMNLSSRVIYWLGGSLYLNVTNRCSNNCYFCFRHYWKGIGGFNLKLEDEPPVDQVIRELLKHVHQRRWKEAVFCGFGEPMVRLDCVLEVTKWIKKHSALKVRIDTNGHGYLLNPRREVIEELREVGVDEVSVSLNGHDRDTYNRVCRPVFSNAYESVLRFIKKTKESLNVEITAVRIPEIDVSKIQTLASQLNIRFRLREYVPCFY